MATSNATNGMMPNATGNSMFDFGGGVNFNPMATSNTSPNASDPFGNMGFGVPTTPANGGAMPSGGMQLQTFNAPVTNQAGSSGSGSYVPSWSPNTSSGVGSNQVNSFTSGSGSTSGMLPYNQNAYNYNTGTNLTNAFGNLGPYLMSLIQTGGYNPQVFQALVNQLQPQINEGIATIGANTGASGTRFGSGYSLALGDYLSQVNLNESAMAANLYEQSVQNSIAGLGIAAGPQAQNKANSGQWWKTLVGDAAQVGMAFL